jgi:hypothetical protein
LEKLAFLDFDNNENIRCQARLFGKPHSYKQLQKRPLLQILGKIIGKISYLKTEGELDIKPTFYRKWKHWKLGTVTQGTS